MYIKNYLLILHTRPKLTLHSSFGSALLRSKSRTTYECADDGVCACVCVCVCVCNGDPVVSWTVRRGCVSYKCFALM